jgi:multiple sugar transport system permease protein
MKNRRLWLGLAFISPWLVGFGAFTLFPLVQAIYYSFCDYCVLTPPFFIGGQNYVAMVHDRVFWLALSNTLFFAVLYLPLSTIFALLLSLLLHLRIPGQGLWRTLYFLPTVVPMVCLAVVWRWLLMGDGGLVNMLLSPLVEAINTLCGTRLHAPNWLLEPGPAFAALVLASLWTVGNTVLIFLAALREVPAHLYEAAEIDGASHWQKYFHVTFPSISPAIFFILVTGFIGCMQTFAVPFVLMNGEDGPKQAMLFLSTYIFRNAFEYWNMGYACALALVLFLLVLVMTLFMVRLLARRVYIAAE